MSTAPFQRSFLSWHRPLLPAVADELLGRVPSDRLWDLSDTLVLVPTREAGRRLREALAFRANQAETGLFPPRVWPAYRILEADNPAIATPLQVQLAFTAILAEADPDAYPALFPAGLLRDGDRQDRFDLAYRAAQPLCELRSLLTEGGIRFREVNERLGEAFEDIDRWNDLARLEQRYQDRLDRLRLVDPLESAIRTAAAPELPPGIRTVIVAAVPDLPTLVVQALERIAEQAPVELLVHAPPDHAELFDECGRPDVPAWQHRELPLDDARIELVSDPDAQAAQTAELLTPWTGTDTPAPAAAVAVGVPDETVIPSLRHALAESGLTSFDPAGIALLRHPLCRLVQNIAALSAQNRYEETARILRHPELQTALRHRHGDSQFSTPTMLSHADRVQNDHLPLTFTAFAKFAGKPETHPNLAKAVNLLKETLATLEDGVSFCAGLRNALTLLLQGRTLTSDSPSDHEFRTVARALVEHLDALDNAAENGLLNSAEDQLAVLSRLLESGRYYFPEPGDEIPDIELQGWLELHWNDAPQFILTGFNDHVVPESVVGHAFLPDSVRTRLNITDNDRRFARDTYLLQAMLASRQPPEGDLRIVLGKQNPDGDVLRPSRLLFQCSPATLPKRALRLFGTVDQSTQAPPQTTTWQLQPPPYTAEAQPETLRVTDFRNYLQCPFRFYLKRILGMEAVDDRKRELDPRDFGTICHSALKAFGRHSELRNSADPDSIAAYLIETARRTIEIQYGQQPPPAVTIQTESIIQRLRAAAEIQARLRADGWEIIAAEVPLEPSRANSFSPLPIRGVVDRIDRHPDGRIRLLDYKTTDTPRKPADTHWGPVRETTADFAITSDGKKDRAWTDLQLPLYALLCDPISDGAVPECGYFNLPKAVTQTGIQLWDNLTAAHLQSAADCAGAVAQSILDGTFWPPAETVEYDDFESLLFGAPAENASPPLLSLT